MEQLRTQFRLAAPQAVREALPLLDQLEPLTMDLVGGRSEFSPSPAETQKLLASFYKVPRTLLIRFKDDSIDETPAFAATFLGGGEEMSVEVSTLAGDHVRPLQQPLPPPPAEVLEAAQQGSAALDTFASFAASLGAPTFPLNALREGVRGALQSVSAPAGPDGTSAAELDIKLLSAHIVSWLERPGPAISQAVSSQSLDGNGTQPAAPSAA